MEESTRGFEQLQAADWVKAISRPVTFVDAVILLEHYRSGLFPYTGASFKHQLLVYKNGFASFFRSGSEIEQLLQGPFLASANSIEKVREIAEKAQQSFRESDEVIAVGQTIKDFAMLQRHGDQLVKVLKENYTYVTLLPYWLLGAIEKAGFTQENPGSYAEVFTLFDPIRGDSRMLNFREQLWPQLWKVLAAQYAISDPELLIALTVDEFLAAVNENTMISEAVLAKRQAGCVAWYSEENKSWQVSYDSELFAQASKLGMTSDVKDGLKGMVAYKGYAKGVARIIYTTADAQTFNDGDIIVSTSTLPALMPYLRRCSAIVTDEGGIASHAAIISRELKKPCVVGTKFATQVIKDGDLIEVDAEKGIVRILDKPEDLSFCILRARKYLPIPCYWNVLTYAHADFAKLYGSAPALYYNYFSPDGTMVAFYEEKSWNKTAHTMVEKLTSDSKYFPTVVYNEKEAADALYALSKTIFATLLTNLGTEELSRLYREIREKWICFNLTSFPLYLISGDVLKVKIEANFPEDISPEDRETLFSSTEKSLTLLEEERLYQAALRVIEGSKPTYQVIENEASLLSDEFGWLPVGYDNVDYWGSDHYVEELTATIEQGEATVKARAFNLGQYELDIQKKIDSIVSNHRITKQVQEWLGMFQRMHRMHDERKKFTFIAHRAWHQVITALAAEFTIEPILFQYLTLEEIESREKVEVDRLFHERRSSYFLVEGRQGAEVTFTMGKEAEEYVQRILEKDLSTDVKGQVANKGGQVTFEGSVQILHSPQESGDFKEGNILVATMTSPDYIQAVRKAKAVVTDEGGVTCHAAIVSRELGIPCIIGTKNASRILQNGDIIRMDLSSGTIHKI